MFTNIEVTGWLHPLTCKIKNTATNKTATAKNIGMDMVMMMTVETRDVNTASHWCKRSGRPESRTSRSLENLPSEIVRLINQSVNQSVVFKSDS